MYQYRAALVDVHDGDTCHLEVDLGCDIRTRLTIRFSGINAPEISTPEGVVARDYLRSVLPSTVWLRTIKDKREKYGRYLGELYLSETQMIAGFAESVNADMLATGHAVTYP